MNDQDAYEVVVTREDAFWLADVPELEGAHTYARTLTGLDRTIREVIVLAANRPDDDMPLLRLDYYYRTGEPQIDDDATEVRTLRAQADELSAAASSRTSHVAEELVARGYSVCDVAAILGVSPQRISQLTRHQAS